MEQRLQLSDSCRGKGGNDAVHVGLNVLTLQARRSHKESFNASFCKQVRSWARMMKGKKNIKEYQKKLRQDLMVFRIFQVSQWNKQLSIQIFTFFFLKVLVSPYSYFKLICCIFVFIQFNKFSLSLSFFFSGHTAGRIWFPYQGWNPCPPQQKGQSQPLDQGQSLIQLLLSCQSLIQQVFLSGKINTTL